MRPVRPLAQRRAWLSTPEGTVKRLARSVLVRGAAAHHQEAGKIVCGVLNAGDEDLHPVRGRRWRSGYGCSVARTAGGQFFDRSGRIICRYRLSAGQRVDEASALGQGGRLRRDVADVR